MNKSKTGRVSCNPYFTQLSISTESILKFPLGSIITQISNVNFGSHGEQKIETNSSLLSPPTSNLKTVPDNNNNNEKTVHRSKAKNQGKRARCHFYTRLLWFHGKHFLSGAILSRSATASWSQTRLQNGVNRRSIVACARDATVMSTVHFKISK